jgi:hypothetical protein
MRNKFKRGEEHYKARFTVEQVLEMRRRRKAGERLKSIAYDFDTSPQTIQDIATGKSWKHVGEIVGLSYAYRD